MLTAWPIISSIRDDEYMKNRKKKKLTFDFRSMDGRFNFEACLTMENATSSRLPTKASNCRVASGMSA